MPDWTWLPLRPIAARVLGEPRSTAWALAGAAGLAATRAGRAVITTAGATGCPPGAARTVAGLRFRAPVVVRVGVGHAEPALRVLPALGAGAVELGPVGADDLPHLRRVLARRPTDLPVVVLCRAGMDPTALQGLADAVATDPEHSPTAGAVPVAGPDDARQAAAAGAELVRVDARQLVELGPQLITRTTDAVLASRAPARPDTGTGWVWAALTGAGMVAGAAGAALITLGPVLLPYDEAFLGADVHALHRLDPNLVGFLQHDRITLAGTMAAIGALYLGLAVAMRRGAAWARTALLASGLVGFPTLAYLLVWGFVEPLHTALTAVLLPMWVAAVRCPPDRAPHRPPVPDGPEPVRRRALVGQLLMVAVGTGLVGAGAVVSGIGLTRVLVATDRDFLLTGAAALDADPRLLAFVAHDRAGFGGALLAAGVAIACTAARGWQRGAAATWWALAAAAALGWLPTIAVHAAVGYLHVQHLLPVYVGLAATSVALALARPHLCAAGGAPGPDDAAHRSGRHTVPIGPTHRPGPADTPSRSGRHAREDGAVSSSAAR